MKKSILYLVVGSIIGGVVGGLVNRAVDAEQLSFDKVTARQFVVVDSRGKKVGVFGSDPRGVHLTLGNGLTVILGVSDEKNATVSINDGTNPRVFMSYFRGYTGGSTLIVAGDDGKKNNVGVCVGNDTGPILSITKNSRMVWAEPLPR